MLDKMVEGFSDEDFRRVMLRSLRLMAIVTAIAAPLLWWKMGWKTAALLVVGAAISGSGLWEWLRLMTAVMVRMDGGAKARPMGLVLMGFFLRLGGAIAVLYVSLRFLDGSVYALAAGLGMGVFALSFEALKMVKAWTV
jgi:hypothetical protein